MLCVLSQRSDRLLSTRHTHSQKTLGATRNREVGVHSDAHGVVVLVRRRQAVRRREVAALAHTGEELAVGGARGDGALVGGLRAAAALAQLEDAAADEARRAAADDRRGDDDEREPEVPDLEAALVDASIGADMIFGIGASKEPSHRAHLASFVKGLYAIRDGEEALG